MHKIVALEMEHFIDQPISRIMLTHMELRAIDALIVGCLYWDMSREQKQHAFSFTKCLCQ